MRSYHAPQYHRSQKFASIYHQPVPLSAIPLIPSTLISIVDFFDGQATSPECH
jgi:hypothetical protein